MEEDAFNERLRAALSSTSPGTAVEQLARAMKADGLTQVAIYRLLAEAQRSMAGEDPAYDAIVDTMDLVWGGPWAKGRALFDSELTSDDLHG